MAKLVCWNCCGLRFEGKPGDSCPNCEHLAMVADYSLPAYDVTCVQEYNSDLEVRSGQLVEFSNLGPIGSGAPGLMTYAINQKYIDLIHAKEKKNIVAVFTHRDLADYVDPSLSIIVSDDPQLDFFRFHNYLVENTKFYWSTRATRMGKFINIVGTAYIAPTDVTIGENVTIGHGVVIMEQTTIESGVTISPGVVIGIDGARFIERGGERFRVRHAGGVYIGADTFIGGNSVIMRGVWRTPTLIGRDVHIGNLCNIGHNSVIGDHSDILPGVIVNGSANVAEKVMASPGAILRGHKFVGEGAWVMMGAVTTTDIPPDAKFSGNFAIPHDKQIKHVKKISK